MTITFCHACSRESNSFCFDCNKPFCSDHVGLSFVTRDFAQQSHDIIVGRMRYFIDLHVTESDIRPDEKRLGGEQVYKSYGSPDIKDHHDTFFPSTLIRQILSSGILTNADDHRRCKDCNHKLNTLVFNNFVQPHVTKAKMDKKVCNIRGQCTYDATHTCSFCGRGGCGYHVGVCKACNKYACSQSWWHNISYGQETNFGSKNSCASNHSHFMRKNNYVIQRIYE